MTAEAPARRRTFTTPRGVILLLLLSAMLFSSVYPMRRTFDVRTRIEALQAEERKLDATAADLQRQKDLLSTEQEVERIAREDLGYVRPGELPFVVARPPEKQAAPSLLDERPAELTIRTAPLLTRWMHIVARALASPL